MTYRQVNLITRYALSLFTALALCLCITPAAAAQSVESTQESVVVNGLDTAQLSGLINALKENEDAGRVTFFSRSRWQDGMRAFTTFTGYEIDGELHHEETREFTLLGDEGVELSGTDTAPGAVEELMYALGTCIIAAGNANAALRGITLSQFDVELESDLDLHGLFALDPKVRAGILEMRSKITIAGDADEDALREIAMLGFQYSPVSESIRNGITVKPEVIVAD
jgi:uncharacterized OsmC-like protein